MEYKLEHKKYFLGLDISTTGAKSLLIDAKGEVIKSINVPITLSTPQPLWSEQAPLDWWSGIVTSIRNLLRDTNIDPKDIVSIGLTGQMHGLVLLDKNGIVLRPAILWNDQRTGKQCDEMRQIIGKERLIQISGNDALTGFTAPKILWVKENEPEIFRQISHILLPKDFIRYCLSAQYAMDKADGSGTILFDLKNRDWSKTLLDELGIRSEWLPRTYEGHEITGRISQKAASETGLREGTPIVGGGGDQSAQAVGVGAIEPGIIALTLGTSGVVFAATSTPLIESEGRLHAFCHALPNRWHLMGVMLSAAGSLQWYRDTLTPDLNFDDLLKEAQNIPIGCEGLFFTPYLCGERTPYPDPYARGAWIGLTVRHRRAHLTRSVLEGVAFGLKDSFQLMKSVGLSEINQVRISGGGAKSLLWRQILASVLNVELVTVNTTEGAAFGAALLAGVGVNNWKNTQTACESTISITGKVTPNLPDVSQYQDYYEEYRSLYPSLKHTFHP
jgi:xylulokinase